jgi:hypothetical protein
MPTSQSKPVLLDNTVLSNFALVKRTDLIRHLWDNCSTRGSAHIWDKTVRGSVPKPQLLDHIIRRT